MAILCKYGELAGCDICEIVRYNTCKKFRHYHLHFMISDVLPFKFNKEFITTKSVVYSASNKDLVKSACVRYAIDRNLKIKKLYFNQVIDMVTKSDSEFMDKVYYLEIEKKQHIEPDKAIGIIESFIDRATMYGAFVGVFSLYALSKRNEWLKVQ